MDSYILTHYVTVVLVDFLFLVCPRHFSRFPICLILLATSYISKKKASWNPGECSWTYCIQLLSYKSGWSNEDRKSFSIWEKVRVTNYSRHNMSCDCIITLWTIDVAVTGEIAISASSMMDFSLIAERGNGERPFLLNFQELKTNIYDLKRLRFRYNFTAIQYDYTCWKHLCICRNTCHTTTTSHLLMDQCKVW